MKISEPKILHDTRSDCYSVIVDMSSTDYLKLVESIYENKGGIEKQREPLKTSSALRIRKQMVSDLRDGAVLPPMVLGVILSEDVFKSMGNNDFSAIQKQIGSSDADSLFIIDGMQRTTALYEASSTDTSALKDKFVRIEFWISNRLNSLIYRMLVLNTGQVPWNLRRQIETVFDSLIKEITSKVKDIELLTIDSNRRRTNAGQYPANDIIELFLAFNGRKEKVDTREKVADEFTRLDFIDSIESPEYSEYFNEALSAMKKFDIVVSKFVPENSDTQEKMRFHEGKDLFKSQPVRIGFITAIAQRIYGRPGFEKQKLDVLKAKQEVFKKLESIFSHIEKLNNEDLEAYLDLNLLNERVSIKSSRVGDFEREFFTKSFETLLNEGPDISGLSTCWHAYY